VNIADSDENLSGLEAPRQHGGEVIKIERLGGEETRKNPPVVRGQSLYFTVYHRGKKSICLDPRTSEGKQIFAWCAGGLGEGGSGVG
jgi:crotonobetainyl-CoA:carnitine CoA-transferase CaiB-like acyl-CoA transferase